MLERAFYPTASDRPHLDRSKAVCELEVCQAGGHREGFDDWVEGQLGREAASPANLELAALV